MSRASIIEAAARAMCAAHGFKWENLLGEIHDHPLIGDYLEQAEAALDSIAPPGEAWIAPWEASEAMKSGYECWSYADREAATGMWRELRDAHLKETEEGMR